MDMKHILTVTFSALMLAGCAETYDRSAGSDCTRPPDRQAGWQLVTPGVWSTGVMQPEEYRFGAGSHKGHAMNTAACFHNDDGKAGKPESRDLQRIGAAAVSASGSRL